MKVNTYNLLPNLLNIGIASNSEKDHTLMQDSDSDTINIINLIMLVLNGSKNKFIQKEIHSCHTEIFIHLILLTFTNLRDLKVKSMKIIQFLIFGTVSRLNNTCMKESKHSLPNIFWLL